MDRGRVSYMRIMIGNDLNSDSLKVYLNPISGFGRIRM